MNRRKSYFQELREQQLAEREREKNNESSKYNSAPPPPPSLPISRVRLPQRPNPLNKILEDVDIWSFDNRQGGSTVNLVQDNPPSASEEGYDNDNQQDPPAAVDEYEDLFNSPRQHDNVTAGPSSSSRTISIVSNRFRKLNEHSSKLKHVLSKSLLSKAKSPGAAGSSTWKTPEKNLEITEPLPPSPSRVPAEGGYTQEVNQLESSITVEESPVSSNKRRHSRRPAVSPKRISFSPVPAPEAAIPTASQSIRLTQSPQVNRKRVQVNSRSQNSSEHLSNLISEVYSSSQSTFSPGSITPVSIWIFEDQTEAFHVDPPESPSKLDDEHSEVNKLVENFKAIKSRYDTSVRLFAHDLRNGKFDEERHLDLFIRKITEKLEKMMVVLAYDLKEKRDRLVLLKTGDVHDIVAEGVVVKLYWPWQQVSLHETNDQMLISTDFYKVVRNSEVNLTDERVQEISELPIPPSPSIGLTEPMFNDMLPTQIKYQQHTVQYHTTRFRTQFDLAGVILYAWTQCSPAVFLVKDANDFLSFMEVPGDDSELMSTLIPGKHLLFDEIQAMEKVFITKKLAPFSVLYLFGAKQTYYFKLKWCEATTCHEEEGLDIPMVELSEALTDFDEIFMAPPNQDHRISLKCRIKEKTDDYILVTDEELDNSLRIDFIFDPVVHMESAISACELNKTGILKFLRVIHGKTLWDHFTTWEVPSPSEDDDSF